MKILSTIISYFVTIYALFGRLGAEKCFFGTTLVFLGQEVDHYMVFIAYHTEFANTRKNEALVGKIANMRLTKIFVGIFALAERLPTSAPLVAVIIFSRSFYISYFQILVMAKGEVIECGTHKELVAAGTISQYL